MSQEQTTDMSQYFYQASAADFMKISGSPIGYWVKQSTLSAFENCDSSKQHFDVRQGMATTDNNRYLRRWSEISFEHIGIGCASAIGGNESGKNWFPYNKGGGYRKWFGNNDFIVNYEKNGECLIDMVRDKYPKISDPEFVIKNRRYYFRPSVTWSFVSSAYFGARFSPVGFIFDVGGSSGFVHDPQKLLIWTSFLCSKVCVWFLKVLNPTLNFQVENIQALPSWESLVNSPSLAKSAQELASRVVAICKYDWNNFETSWDFENLPIIGFRRDYLVLRDNYKGLRECWAIATKEMSRSEEENNRLFIDAYGLQDELSPEVSLEEITLTCNPHYRYGGNRSDEELESMLQCDTLRELLSYAIGCMMGRYSLDKPGLILASQGETLQDYLAQIPSPRFAPDADAILPLTDQEWFADDATHRLREFVRVVWGDETLQQNLDFIAESLCLHAIKPPSAKSGGESALDTIRRYLSTQFYKDHLRTYKRRPIYWLFSSGKHKAFECLVYLHRYHEGTLARMRTEYVIPLSAKLNSYAEKLEQDKDASASTAETKRVEKELAALHKQQAELAEFDEKLRHYADQRITLDLDDGVKVNYGKFGDLLADVKAVTGE